MKKLFIGLLCVIMTFTLLGCGGTDSSSTEEPLTDEEIIALFNDPTPFKGRTVELVGQVNDIKQLDSSTTLIQAFCDWENIGEGIIVEYTSDTASIKTDDFVKIVGTVDGTYEGENLLGVTMNYPQIKSNNVEVSSYMDIAVPTKKEIIPESNTIDQHGYVITVDKIEFADTETRVYVTVTNNGSDTFSFYDFNGKIVQGNNQYDATDNYNAEYEKVQSEILPGISSSGIVVFDAVKDADFTLLLDGYSDDYNLDFDEYKYEIIIE